MSSVFTLDGVAYNVRIPEGGIKRSSQILDGSNAGRSQGTGVMIRDLIGTYYNYSIEVDTSALEASEYDKLYEAITAPVDSHTLTVPYAQTTLTFQAYITKAEDTLESMAGGVNHWTGLVMSFVAMAPQRTP